MIAFRTAPVVGALVLATFVVSAVADAQGVPRLRKLTVAGQGFAIDVPERDWSLLPGGNTSLLSIVQKRFEAALVVERTPLQVELAPEDIGEVFLSIEADRIREIAPSAADIKADLQELGGRRVAAFVYRRNGVLGAERVLQYSMPIGNVLYRIVAVARADRFDTHLAALQAVAASLSPQ